MANHLKILLGTQKNVLDHVGYVIKRGISFETATQLGKVYSRGPPIEGHYLIQYEHFGESDFDVLTEVVGVAHDLQDLDKRAYDLALKFAFGKSRNNQLSLESLVDQARQPVVSHN